MAELSPAEVAELFAADVARAKKYAALVIVAVAVAVVVLVLDYMIKNAIMEQIREADRSVSNARQPAAPPRPEHPFRGGDLDDSRGPIGRGGMVTGAGMGEGTPQDDGPLPGSFSRRVAGPPLSTDRDSSRSDNGSPGGVAVPPDGEA